MSDSATEPFELGEGSTGVLLIHGFSGSPASMRPWGEYLAAQRYRVRAPLLPGHGTRWQDLKDVRWQQWVEEVDGAFDALAAEVDDVVVAGMSMGGALALHLAQQRGEAVRAVVVVNPAVQRPNRLDAFVLAQVKRLGVLGMLAPVLPPVPGVINDIKKPDQDEHGYDKLPVAGGAQFVDMVDRVRGRLSEVTQPLLVLSAPEDHVIEPVNSRIVISQVSSARRSMVLLENSYHVATLDYDAELIFSETARFVEDVLAAA